MTEDQNAPLQTMWEGKYIRAMKRGRWEYVSRTNATSASSLGSTAGREGTRTRMWKWFDRTQNVTTCKP